ncbi:MAG: hypothetical protein J6K17_05500 [Oscillospiraceae bacterium]|nr:hypothetical protein [Oscillospiraceae bacterium]
MTCKKCGKELTGNTERKYCKNCESKNWDAVKKAGIVATVLSGTFVICKKGINQITKIITKII